MNPLWINWNVNPEIFTIGGFSLRYYSLLFAVAFFLGFRLMEKMYREEGIHEKKITPLLIYVLVGTVVGARLGQTLFYEFDYFKHHPLEIFLPFRIGTEGFELTGFRGLASHGGAVGILIALALYCKKYSQPFLWVVDRLVIVVALAGFFIRLGNLFNSEIIGKPASVPWAIVFLKVDNVPRHPSQLYEAFAYLFIFFFLLALYRNKSHDMKKGVLFGWFLVTVFTARFLIEFTKEPQETFENHLLLNMGQLLSIPFVLAGLYFIIRKQQRGNGAILSTNNNHHGTQPSP